MSGESDEVPVVEEEVNFANRLESPKSLDMQINEIVNDQVTLDLLQIPVPYNPSHTYQALRDNPSLRIEGDSYKGTCIDTYFGPHWNDHTVQGDRINIAGFPTTKRDLKIRFIQAKVTPKSSFCRGQFYTVTHKDKQRHPLFAFLHGFVESHERTDQTFKPARPIISFFPPLVPADRPLCACGKCDTDKESLYCLNTRSLCGPVETDRILEETLSSSEDLLDFVRDQSTKFCDFTLEPSFMCNSFDFTSETVLPSAAPYSLIPEPTRARGD